MSRVNDLNMQIDGAGGYSFDCDAIVLSVVHGSVNFVFASSKQSDVWR